MGSYNAYPLETIPEEPDPSILIEPHRVTIIAAAKQHHSGVLPSYQDFVADADPFDSRAVFGYRYIRRGKRSMEDRKFERIVEEMPHGCWVIPRRSARIAANKRKKTA